MKKKVVVFTGSGISAESGLQTFRDSGGLWEKYNVEDVATPAAWRKNPALVLEFYNKRRKQTIEAQPNAAHLTLVKLKKKFDMHIITQNIDDLHERAGSEKVLHLHGEVRKARSSVDSQLVYEINGKDLKWGDLCEKKSQLRPHIVWFGEPVPEMENAIHLTSQADIFIVIGTSLNVYPAADLINYAPNQAEKYLIDPNADNMKHIPNLFLIQEKAGIAVPQLVKKLLNKK